MDWLNQMNAAMSYIESNITERIDYGTVAKIACCSSTKFQKMFSFMTDLSIGEYVRRRKLSLAAAEIIGSDIKVIDIALKYGYQSPESFTRAFHAFHGVSPSIARKHGIFTAFSPITFKIQIIGGNVMTGSKPLVRIESLENLKAVCFYANCAEPETPAWYQLRNWVAENANDYSARRYIGFAPSGHHPTGENNDLHEYKAQMILYEEEIPMFQGAELCDAPRGLFLVGDVVLNEYNEDGSIDIGASMKKSSQVIYECMLSMGGYEIDFAGRTYLEEHIFDNEWFTDESPEKYQTQFKFWLPIKRQENK